MKEKNVKLEEERKILEEINKELKKYIRLKDEKGDKASLDKGSLELEKLFNDNPWVEVCWKEAKRSKLSRMDAIEKVKEKINTRKNKIKAEEEELEKIKNPERDWSDEIADCSIGKVYFHWAYGEMKVVEENDDYIYLEIKDKKGCKGQWLEKNVILKTINGKEKETKEFAKNSIGKWLLPKKEDVKIIDKETAHKSM